MSPLLLLLSSTLGLCLIFAGVHALARRIDNYGIVDIAWSWAFALVAASYAVAAAGWPIRRGFIGAMAVLWSLRLGSHLYQRVMSHHPVEDGRYAQLRRDWADNFSRKMAGFFQLQAVSVILLASPFLLASINPTPGTQPLEMAGALLWLIALTGEAVADGQLRAFKSRAHNRGRVCQAGLWRYSRHPNYFFEWLVWVAFALFATASPWGWIAWLSPAIMLYLLLRMTGIPLTEQQSIRSKGDAYRHYQETTSAFVPWFRRKQPARERSA